MAIASSSWLTADLLLAPRTSVASRYPGSCEAQIKALLRICQPYLGSTPIHRSAWKWNSANFALTEFSEVRALLCALSHIILYTIAHNPSSER
jgi:hypothetical protein